MKKFVCAMLTVVMLLALGVSANAEGAIKIGMSGPMTGGAADYGISTRNGEQLAVDEINALGGIQLELNAQDDEGDAEKAINAYNVLMDWGMQMMAGTVTTTPCTAVAAQAYEERLFMLTPSASSPVVTEGKDNVFRICFSDPDQGSASAQYIADKKLAQKVAVIYNNSDSYSTGIYQVFEAKAKELGLEVVSVSTFTEDTTDFSVQISSAKQAGAELVFLPIYYTPASMILKQAAVMDYKPTFFGVDGMDGILGIEGFDTSLAEGVLLLTPFSADSKEEKSAAFTAAYEAKYGVAPTQFAADGYDAIYALYDAIVKTGITADTPYEECCEKLVSVFPTMEVAGVTGTMTWNDKGDASKEPYAVVIKNGAYVGME